MTARDAGAVLVATARRLADEVLFPAALQTDAAGIVPGAHLDALAEAGLYGLAGPIDAGGHDVDIDTVSRVIEALASGCLTTTFVYTQHHGVVRTIAASAPAAMRKEWLPALCSGRKRAGVALAVMPPGPPLLTATPVEGGWILDGRAPWVTGWGRIDVVLTSARTPDGRVARLLFDAPRRPEGGQAALQADSLRVEVLRMVAVQASGTVRLRFAEHFVPQDRLVSLEVVREDSAAYNPAGLRSNGSLALGVTSRCCTLLGPTALDDELPACRDALDAATEETVAGARAAASELAMRAAAALVAHGGSQSVLLDQHAQRLAREALFLLAFGQRPAIRARLLERLHAHPR